MAVEEGLSLAGVLLLVAQKALLQDFRSPWLVLKLQAQLAPQEVAVVVCWGEVCSGRYWVNAVSRVAKYPAEGC